MCYTQKESNLYIMANIKRLRRKNEKKKPPIKLKFIWRLEEPTEAELRKFYDQYIEKELAEGPY